MTWHSPIKQHKCVILMSWKLLLLLLVFVSGVNEDFGSPFFVVVPSGLDYCFEFVCVRYYNVVR